MILFLAQRMMVLTLGRSSSSGQTISTIFSALTKQVGSSVTSGLIAVRLEVV
jgi:hypothetical protein